jgi:hypothetical protein
MASRKSQTTMEFVLIISLVLFLMLIALYMITDYAFKSGKDIAGSQLQQIGRTLTDQSREVYYLGLFSQEIISVNIPDGIQAMQTLSINKGTSTENYYITSIFAGGRLVNVTFPAEVPLVTSGCADAICSGYPCTRCMFQPNDYSSGRKDLKLETIAWKGGYAVNITRVFI